MAKPKKPRVKKVRFNAIGESDKLTEEEINNAEKKIIETYEDDPEDMRKKRGSENTDRIKELVHTVYRETTLLPEEIHRKLLKELNLNVSIATIKNWVYYSNPSWRTEREVHIAEVERARKEAYEEEQRNIKEKERQRLKENRELLEQFNKEALDDIKMIRNAIRAKYKASVKEEKITSMSGKVSTEVLPILKTIEIQQLSVSEGIIVDKAKTILGGVIDTFEEAKDITKELENIDKELAEHKEEYVRDDVEGNTDNIVEVDFKKDGTE